MGTKRSKPTVRQLRETAKVYDAPTEVAPTPSTIPVVTEHEPELVDMTLRQRRLVAGVINGEPISTAAIHAGYSEHTARQVGHGALAQINKSDGFRALLARVGLDDATLANAIRQGATESLEYGLSRSGESVPLGPAWHARAKFVDMALKVGRHYPDRTVDVQVTGAVVVKAATDAAPDPFAVIEGEYQVQE